jgi:hypothetical protein
MYLDALNRRALLVDDHSVDVPSKNDRDRCLVLARGGLAEVDYSPADARKDTLQVGQRLLELRLALGFALLDAGLEDLVVDVVQLLVQLLLQLAGRLLARKGQQQRMGSHTRSWLARPDSCRASASPRLARVEDAPRFLGASSRHQQVSMSKKPVTHIVFLRFLGAFFLQQALAALSETFLLLAELAEGTLGRFLVASQRLKSLALLDGKNVRPSFTRVILERRCPSR